MTVNTTLTPKRRSRRGRGERSVEEYLGAVRRMLRAAAVRVGESDEHQLRELLELQDVLDEAIADAVDRQRAWGKSWAAIALATGTTRQGAFQRWGRRKAG